MKILVSQKVEGIAGSEKYLINLLPGLKANSIDAEFLILYPKGKENLIEAFEKALNDKFVVVYKLGISNVPSLSDLKKIFKVIKKGQYDLIHSNLLSTDLIFSTIKILYDRKMIIVSGKHGYEESYNNNYGFDPSKKRINLYWACARFAELFINRSFVISIGLYKLYLGLDICKKDKLDIINYGFDFDDNYKFIQQFRYGNPQLVIVGRLTEFKGHRYAIKAVKKLVIKYPNIKLVIVGWGELEDQLKKIVRDLELEENVIFAGFHANPRNAMFTSDIVLLPSVSEGFGIVVLEAMSVKRPVVAFNVPSPSEIFRHRETGLLASPYLIDEYANLIEELIERPDYRNWLAQNAYLQLKEHYNLSRMLTETIQFYIKVISKAKRK